MWVIGVPLMKSTWRVSKIVNGTAEPQTQGSTYVSRNPVNTAASVETTASPSRTVSYNLSSGDHVITVTIGEVRPEKLQYNSGRISEIGSSLVTGFANAFVMAPHHGGDVMSCWNRDFDKIASDLKKVVVRANERVGKQRR
jgi:hypothetical protein